MDTRNRVVGDWSELAGSLPFSGFWKTRLRWITGCSFSPMDLGPSPIPKADPFPYKGLQKSIGSDQSTDCHVGLGFQFWLCSPSLGDWTWTSLDLSFSLYIRRLDQMVQKATPSECGSFPWFRKLPHGPPWAVPPQALDPAFCFLAAAEPGPGRGWLPGTASPRQSPGSPKSGMGPQAAVTMTNARVLPGWGPGLLKKGKEDC